MTTVGALVDQVFRNYLEPPDAQPARVESTNDLLIGGDQLTLEDFEVPEDENLLRVGTPIEIAQELMRVTAWDALGRTATVQRAILGTEEADHPAGSLVKLQPPYARLSVFHAVRNNIIGLYPRLWTARTQHIAPVARGVFPIEDPLVAEVIEVNPEGYDWTSDVMGRIVDFHQLANGRAFISNVHVGNTLYARLRRRFGVAESETDTYEDIGLEVVWETVVAVGAAADVMSGRDVPAALVNWVSAPLESENIEVGTRTQLALGLARYREILLDRHSREMAAEDSNKARVLMMDPFGQVVR